MNQNTETLYQSILYQLSNIPSTYLAEVNQMLSSFAKDLEKKQENRAYILSFAGAWDELAETDFQEIREVARDTGSEMFNRAIEL